MAGAFYLAVMTAAAVAALLGYMYYSSGGHQEQQYEECLGQGCNYHFDRHERPSNSRRQRRREQDDVAGGSDTHPHHNRYEEGEKCPICLDSIWFLPQKTLQCRHRIHSSCYNDLRARGGVDCPICRKSL